MSENTARTPAEEALKILEEAYAYYTPAEDMVEVMEVENTYVDYLEAA